MATVDRTDDFFKAASVHISTGVRPVQTLNTSGRRNPAEDAKEFTKKAAAISKKIQLTSKRLARLADLTRKQGIYDDKADEINSLATQLKHDTTLHKSELDHLEAYLASRKQSGAATGDATAHSKTIVSAMKVQLTNTFADFKSILEQRQTSIQKKSNRRGLFGKNKFTPLSAPVPVNHVSNANRQPPLQPGRINNNIQVQHQPLLTGNINISGTNGVPHQQVSALSSTHTAPPMAAADNNFNNDSLVDNDGEPMVLIQATETLQDDSYLSSRAEAMSAIESHITELGQVFNQLSSMVAQSAQSIDRIDSNVQDSLINMEMGTAQLEQTWDGIRGNKWLAAKIMAVLLFFITFFITFLA